MDINAIFVGSLGLLASVITASLSYFFTKKHQLKIENRRLKEEYYKFFIKTLSDVAINNSDETANQKLSESFNSLLIIGSTKVVERLMEFHDFVKKSNKEIPRDSKEWSIKHDHLLKELVIEIRRDLYGSEKKAKHKLNNLHLVGN